MSLRSISNNMEIDVTTSRNTDQPNSPSLWRFVIKNVRKRPIEKIPNFQGGEGRDIFPGTFEAPGKMFLLPGDRHDY